MQVGILDVRLWRVYMTAWPAFCPLELSEAGHHMVRPGIGQGG